MMTKEQVFEEFKIAKQKDLQQSTQNEPYEDVFTNRLQLLNSHKVAKKSNPKMYRNLDINFDNLILAYSSPVPVDHFYKKVFGKTLSEYTHDKSLIANQDFKKGTQIAFLVDMWEHSYLLDTTKDKYLDSIWRIINWSIVNDRIQGE